MKRKKPVRRPKRPIAPPGPTLAERVAALELVTEALTLQVSPTQLNGYMRKATARRSQASVDEAVAAGALKEVKAWTPKSEVVRFSQHHAGVCICDAILADRKGLDERSLMALVGKAVGDEVAPDDSGVTGRLTGIWERP
jgi:hypothetical protein